MSCSLPSEQRGRLTGRENLGTGEKTRISMLGDILKTTFSVGGRPTIFFYEWPPTLHALYERTAHV